jgi:hypothetical protein
MKLRFTAFALSIALVALGCGKDDKPKTGTVKGKVTLDGSPMTEGKIVFDGESGVPAAEFDVKAGEYSGTVIAGKKTIRISAFKTVPGPKGMVGYEKGIEQNYLPAKYNTASTDIKEVKEGDNSFDFEVKTK